MAKIDVDSSSRFVLPKDAPYLANLAALWTVDADLAAAVEAVPDGDVYPTTLAKSGDRTLAVRAADGRTIQLHSRYAPVDEAKRLADSINITDAVGFYIFGLGLGYHVEQLFDRAGDEAIFAIFEPDLFLLRTALAARDLSRLISSRRVLFFTSPDSAALMTRLLPHATLFAVGAAKLSHPPSQELAGPFHERMRVAVDGFASFTRTSLNTLILNGRRTAENISKNLAWYIAAPGVSRLKDRHAGEPAIIVSAGPSLRKNKHLLKRASANAVIVSVQTTLQPLLDLGVEPHYVTSLDYHDICTRFFEKLPPTVRTELVAEPKASSAIFSMYPGPLSLLGNDYAEALLREQPPEKTKLPGGATVAHLAYYLAEHLGCNPIIFVGQDLGFSDGLCYAPGTSYEDVWRPELSRFCSVEMKQWDQIVRERFILRRIPDHLGRPMYTEERLFTYLQQFERDFSLSKQTIIDATEGGALKRGTIAMTLADALTKHCSIPLRPASNDHGGLDAGRVHAARASVENRRSEAVEIRRISEATLPLLAEIAEHISNQPRVNRAIAQIDSLRARMNELGQTYDLITQLTQSTELQRFKEDRRIAASRLEPSAKQRRQVLRDVENVKGVMQAAEEFGRMMTEVLSELQNFTPGRRRKEAA